jgi:hypothetical protein
MPAVIECEVRLIVVKQAELDSVISGAIKEELVQGVRVRVDTGNVFDPVRVLKDGSFLLEQVTHRLLGL